MKQRSANDQRCRLQSTRKNEEIFVGEQEQISFEIKASICSQSPTFSQDQMFEELLQNCYDYPWLPCVLDPYQTVR